MTHIVCLYNTDDGIVMLKPYALHPLCGKEDAELIGCGLLYEAGYSPGNNHAIWAFPYTECLTKYVDDEFYAKSYNELVLAYGEDMMEAAFVMY